MADAVIGALRVTLGADSAAFETQMNGIAAKLQGIGKNLQLAGAGLTAGITLPFLKLGEAAYNAFAESEKAVAGLNAALASTGGKIGLTTEQLQKMAGELQKISTYDDDEIMSKVTTNLLSFGNISKDVFQDAQKAILDISTRLGVDLQTATLKVGRAINDPVKGLGGLKSLGVQFSSSQEKMIAGLMKIGDRAGATKIILDQVFSKFGGQAEAAANTAAGRIQQMQNAIGSALEAIGGIIAPYVKAFAETVASIADAFTGLDPSIQNFIVVVGGIAAAMGPVLIAIGFLLPAITAIGPALALLASPIGAFVLAIAGISIAINAMGVDFGTQFEVVKTAFGFLIDVATRQIAFFKNLITGDFAGAWEQAKGIVTDALGAIGNIIELLFPGLIESVGKNVSSIGGFFVKLKDDAVQAMSDLYNGVKTWLQDKLGEVMDWVTKKLGDLADAFWMVYDKVVGHSYIPDMVTESTAWLKQLGTSMDKIGGDAVSNWNDHMASMTSANAKISTGEAPSVKAANDNSGGIGRGRGDVYLGGITIQAADYASFAQSKGQVQADLSDMVRAAFAGR